MRLISTLIRDHSLSKFFTLTLDRDMIPYDRKEMEQVDAWEYVHVPWTRFRKRMKRRGDFKFVAILEAHKNTQYPHIHGFTNLWMDQKEWSRKWDECRGGRVVWVEKVESESLSTYVTKSLDVAKYVGKENLTDGYKQKGGHRTLWRSKNMKAEFELTTLSGWVMIKEHVFRDNGEMSDYYAMKGIWNGSEEERQGEDLEAARRAISE